MNTKHTPRPWKYDIDQTTQGVAHMIRHAGQAVANVRSNNKDSAEAEANARLIAAAPELLEACEGLLGLAERQGWLHVAVNAARAAIAKATGTAA